MNPPVRMLYKIAARPDGPAQARRIVARECSRRVSARALEDFELLVSELVTNRIVHGEPGADNTVLLDLRVYSTLCCAVRIANRWGSHRTRTGGTRVWCETAPA